MTIRSVIRRETSAAILFNIVLSGIGAVSTFGWGGVWPVWGHAGYVHDALGQGAIAGTCSFFFPAFLTRLKIRSGKGGDYKVRPLSSWSLLGLALCVGLLCAGLLYGLTYLIFMLFPLAVLPFLVGLATKMLIGAAIAIAVTPPGLRCVLAD